jgi:hypothetical protein
LGVRPCRPWRSEESIFDNSLKIGGGVDFV